MYYSCITHVFGLNANLNQELKKHKKQQIHMKYMYNTCYLHEIPITEPDFQCISHVFKKNQCIFRLREIGKNHMYFTCISHVFL